MSNLTAIHAEHNENLMYSKISCSNMPWDQGQGQMFSYTRLHRLLTECAAILTSQARLVQGHGGPLGLVQGLQLGLGGPDSLGGQGELDLGVVELQSVGIHAPSQ